MTCPPHHYVFPMPDGEISLGVCACGATQIGRNWEAEVRLSKNAGRKKQHPVVLTPPDRTTVSSVKGGIR